ncbi:hypothetical protein NUU61_006859 [Penicillium alfredii]|uniref:Mid2 domain-containing protein n=1 Tax=Penicillium alfredii TaxID=1506179 RepID=A0A9W9F1S8_9EURO|nr:uncharacterized protein NUU61_006859 [Penicillium alfredii]KAJ5091989.1 hypothetical protein NUU61_006859 [Penicillium alfredii]
MQLLALYALSCIPLAHGWNFLSTNSSDKAVIKGGTGNQTCTKVSQTKGKKWSWDPEGEKLCISIYYDNKCDTKGGYFCAAAQKDAGNDFESFEVLPDRDGANSLGTVTVTPTPSATSTSSSTSSATTTPTSTSTDTASNGQSSSGSSLSGGAIAGIVIGVVAGVSLIAAAFFFVGRRHRKNAAAAAVAAHHAGYANQGPPLAGSYGPSSSGFTEKPPNSSSGSPYQPVPGDRLAELNAERRTAELAYSPVSELDATARGPTSRS